MSALERVRIAATTICGDGDIYNRIGSAFLTLAPLKDGDFPPKLRRLYRAAMNSSLRRDTIPALSVDEAEQITKGILELYVRVRIIESRRGDRCDPTVD